MISNDRSELQNLTVHRRRNIIHISTCKLTNFKVKIDRMTDLYK